MKRISPATVTFGVMAIVLGLVAAYIVRQSMQKPPVVQAPRPAVDRGVPCVVARHNIAPNTRLTSEDVMVAFAPRGSKVVAKAYSNPEIAIGRITKKPIKANNVIREEYLLGIGESLPDLADRIPPGLRALAIDVEGATTGGKPLSDGDLVDISMTVEGTHPDLGEVTTRTLLQDVLVMDSANDTPRMRGTRRSNGTVTTGITVAVSPADANKLMVAQRTGILSVALRSVKDAGVKGDEADAMNRRDLLGLTPVPAPKPVRKFTIEHYSGGSRKVIEISNDRVMESRVGPSGKQFETDDEAPEAASLKADPKSASLPVGQSGVSVPTITGTEDLQ